ncbi:MAG: hypothetical protein ABIO72_02575 [Patescibacteria group bacterium]
MAKFRVGIDSIGLYTKRSSPRQSDSVYYEVRIATEGRVTKLTYAQDYFDGQGRSYPIVGGALLAEVEVIDPNSEVSISFVMVNAGNQSNRDNYLRAAAAVCEILASKVEGIEEGGIFTWAAAKVISLIPKGIGIVAPDCDGPLAADRFAFRAGDIGHLRTFSRLYPGVDSASGCGRNSYYQVNGLTHVLVPFDSHGVPAPHQPPPSLRPPVQKVTHETTTSQAYQGVPTPSGGAYLWTRLRTQIAGDSQFVEGLAWVSEFADGHDRIRTARLRLRIVLGDELNFDKPALDDSADGELSIGRAFTIPALSPIGFVVYARWFQLQPGDGSEVAITQWDGVKFVSSAEHFVRSMG